MEAAIEMRMINIGQRAFQITSMAAHKLISDHILRVCAMPGCDLHLAHPKIALNNDSIGALMAAAIDGALLQLSSDIAAVALEEKDPRIGEEEKIETPADVLRAAVKRANDKQHEVIHTSGKEASSAIKQAMDEARAKGVSTRDAEKILAEVMFGDLGAMIRNVGKAATNGTGAPEAG